MLPYLALAGFLLATIVISRHLKNLEATWTQMWPLPSPSQNPVPHPCPERKVPCALRHDPLSCLLVSLKSRDNSHWVRVEPFPALKQICLMLPYKEKLIMNVSLLSVKSKLGVSHSE